MSHSQRLEQLLSKANGFLFEVQVYAALQSPETLQAITAVQSIICELQAGLLHKETLPWAHSRGLARTLSIAMNACLKTIHTFEQNKAKESLRLSFNRFYVECPFTLELARLLVEQGDEKHHFMGRNFLEAASLLRKFLVLVASIEPFATHVFMTHLYGISNRSSETLRILARLGQVYPSIAALALEELVQMRHNATEAFRDVLSTTDILSEGILHLLDDKLKAETSAVAGEIDCLLVSVKMQALVARHFPTGLPMISGVASILNRPASLSEETILAIRQAWEIAFTERRRRLRKGRAVARANGRLGQLRGLLVGAAKQLEKLGVSESVPNLVRTTMQVLLAKVARVIRSLEADCLAWAELHEFRTFASQALTCWARVVDRLVSRAANGFARGNYADLKSFATVSKKHWTADAHSHKQFVDFAEVLQQLHKATKISKSERNILVDAALEMIFGYDKSLCKHLCNVAEDCYTSETISTSEVERTLEETVQYLANVGASEGPARDILVHFEGPAFTDELFEQHRRTLLVMSTKKTKELRHQRLFDLLVHCRNWVIRRDWIIRRHLVSALKVAFVDGLPHGALGLRSKPSLDTAGMTKSTTRLLHAPSPTGEPSGSVDDDTPLVSNLGSPGSDADADDVDLFDCCHTFCCWNDD